MVLNDFEIICSLNFKSSTINSYKAKKLSSDEFVMLHSIDCTKIGSFADKLHLIDTIRSRTRIEHPNLLNFVDFFEDEPIQIMYVVSEHCQNGSLNNVIDDCKKEKKRLSEELICKILYQILCAIKTTGSFTCRLSLDHIFIDHNYNVKLSNLEPFLKKLNDTKMYQLARLIYNICTLKPYNRSEADEEIQKLQTVYSSNLLDLLGSMLKDHRVLCKNIDKILCNSTILLKSSQWKMTKSFIVTSDLPEMCADLSEAYLQKLRNLLEKETYLRAKEEKLAEKERSLISREKKLTVMERLVKEKMTQAELYLKRNRKIKTTTSADLCDGDYASISPYCDDSKTVTSGKMDENLPKPAAFVRSRSERRIRFKGHSPLKELNFSNHRRSVRRSCIFPKPHTDVIEEKENCTSSSELLSKIISDKVAVDSGSDDLKRSKKLFSDSNEQHANVVPVTWTEESKKQAFDLLRMMQGNNHIKHTYL